LVSIDPINNYHKSKQPLKSESPIRLREQKYADSDFLVEQEPKLIFISGIDNTRARILDFLRMHPGGVHERAVIEGAGLSKKPVIKALRELAQTGVIIKEKGSRGRVFCRINTKSPAFSIKIFLENLKKYYQKRANKKPNSFTNHDYAAASYVITSQAGHIFLKRTLAIILAGMQSRDLYNEIFADAVNICDEILLIIRKHIVNLNPEDVHFELNKFMNPTYLAGWLKELYAGILQIESALKGKQKAPLVVALKLSLKAYLPVLNRKQSKELFKIVNKYERQPIGNRPF